MERPDESATLGKHVADAELINDRGESFRLSDLAGKPLLISPVFLRCPHACPTMTDNLRARLADIGVPGERYNMLTVSFDPADSAEDLRAYRSEHDLPDGWVLAVADSGGVDSLLASLDFNYAPGVGGFAHANLVAVLTPDLEVSGYLYGLTYEDRQIRAALMTASSGPSLVSKYRPLILIAMALSALAVAFALIATGKRSPRMS